jgi:cation-transporting ATPase E
MLLSPGHALFARIAPHTAEARRVVLFARVDRLAPEVGDMTVLPAALVVLSECIRDDAAETLRFFREQGVTLKIISGDNPSTVAAIARSVGFEVESGADMRDVGDTADDVLDVVTTHSVFGRVSPQQKRSMVQALQSRGEVVAMTGDGVNDVLALKQADIGVAMENGAPATKAVAQMILLDGRFSRLPSVLAEGRRVIANVERVANLFIVKNAMSLLSIVMAAVFVVKYPFLPRHLTMISTLTIGIPSFFLALAPNNRRYVPGFLKRVLSFSLPAGVLTGISALVASWVNSTWFDTTKNVSCAVTGTDNHVHACWQGGSAATLAAMIVFVWILTNLAHPINGWKTILISSIIGCTVVAFLFGPIATALRLSLPWQLAVWSAVVGACGAAGIEIFHRLSNRHR